MRKVMVLGLIFVGFASLASAAQRHMAAPAPVARPMPAGPVGGTHMAPMHPPSVSRPGIRPVGGTRMAPTLPYRSTLHSGSVQQSSGNGESNHNREWNHNHNDRNAGNRIRNTYCSGQPLNNYLGNPVPGFGFDYEHFFAVHPNWNVCNQLSSGGLFGYPYGGGYYVPYYPEGAQAQQGGQENASNEQDSSRQIAVQDSTPPSSARQSSYSYSPAEPVAEFVFVKRDGSTFNAVAFTLLKDKIRYVTRDGLRRTVPLDSLDLEATQKTNEERGTTIELPGLSHA